MFDRLVADNNIDSSTGLPTPIHPNTKVFTSMSKTNLDQSHTLVKKVSIDIKNESSVVPSLTTKKASIDIRNRM